MSDFSPLSPIGVFDSGVGGIGVLAELLRVMPSEDFIYIGDSANAPYGEKSVTEVQQCAHGVVRRLLDMGVKAIVIACNTATSAAVSFLRETYPTIPIIGMEPAVKPAALSSKHPTVLVMATPLTIRENRLRSLIAEYSTHADFIDVPCHGLVELVERGVTSGDEMNSLLSGILDNVISGRRIDAAVLGCTHFIHAREAIAHTVKTHSPSSDVKIFDGAHGTALETLRRLEKANLISNGTAKRRVEILNSSNDNKLIELSHLLLDAAYTRKDI